MILRELINSVNSEKYSDNQLYQELREIKPEDGSSSPLLSSFIMSGKSAENRVWLFDRSRMISSEMTVVNSRSYVSAVTKLRFDTHKVPLS